jgi:hypothetical protein
MFFDDGGRGGIFASGIHMGISIGFSFFEYILL